MSLPQLHHGLGKLGISSIYIVEDTFFQEGRSSGGVGGRKWLEGIPKEG